MARKVKADMSLVLLAVIVLLAGGAFAFMLMFFNTDGEDEAFSGDRVINVLFVIENGGKPLASYALLYYPVTNRAAIFDVPGETGLIIERIKRVDRIDMVYSSGDIKPYAAEVGNLLAATINFSLVITTENLGRAVDLLEGVDIFIPVPVAIFDQGPPVLFPSGLARLDGDKARSYVTYAQAGEEREIAVFRRQRFFLSLIKRLGEQAASLENETVSRMFYSLFHSAAGRRSKARLFAELARIDTDRTNVQSVGGTAREVSGQTLLFPFYNGSLIKEIVRQAYGSLTRQDSSGERLLTVEVLNGTGVNGLAGRTAELLRSFGYDVISVGNAEGGDYTSTEVVDRSGIEGAAEIFGDVIRCTNIRNEQPLDETAEGWAPPGGLPADELELENYEYKSDFTLILGRDFDGRYVSGR